MESTFIFVVLLQIAIEPFARQYETAKSFEFEPSMELLAGPISTTAQSLIFKSKFMAKAK